ncbi:unnamed protein product [Schistosoma haematobium]|uniref:Methylmalonic aciduria type A-like protein, mitochondrial n=1 Tax=Schistosoma haematobium TaxID=6185 RepID=A0A095AN01_SCHHA|nr:unnamed protein product [Schistosoma haematobium]CAH8592824.1 unnamed protein product [Schistosoma haematobium]
MLRLCSHIHISYGRFRVFSCKHSKKYIHSSIPIISQKITSLSINQTEYAKTLADSLIQGNRYSLARAITLLESSKAERRAEGQYILDAVIKHLAHQELKTGKFTFRIGLSGPPGAGKSTFIEAFGGRLTGSKPWNPVINTSYKSYGKQRLTLDEEHFNQEIRKLHRVAVLAIDPSSHTTGGSLLADKTRMPELSSNLNAYIRPSPSGGNLGGVARATSESILLCEAAGFETVLVETVGVGQLEFAAADMVDMFVLIIPPAGGDELQGIKRGIVEVADLVLVNKADGELLHQARLIAKEYSNALKYMRCRRPNWIPKVQLVSSLTGDGLIEFWSTAFKFHQSLIKSGELQRIRKEQLRIWMWTFVKEEVWRRFKNSPLILEKQKEIETLLFNREIAPGIAAELLLDIDHRKS